MSTAPARKSQGEPAKDGAASATKVKAVCVACVSMAGAGGTGVLGAVGIWGLVPWLAFVGVGAVLVIVALMLYTVMRI